MQERKILTPELKQKIELRVRECLDQAKQIWPGYQKFDVMPTIRYNVKNTFGGLAISGGKDDWTIRFNLILCYENEEHFIRETVGHEVAHLIQRVVYGNTKTIMVKGEPVVRKVMSHGAEWKEVMTKLGLKPEKYHHYDVSSIDTGKKSELSEIRFWAILQIRQQKSCEF